MLSSYPDVLAFRNAVISLYPGLKDNGRFIIPSGDREFWDFYHAHKDELRHAKIVVYKDGQDWICPAKRLYNPLRELREKCDDRLIGCCVDFQDMLINERVCSNGARQYRLLCPVCKRKIPDAMPHPLVTALLSVGREVVPL